MEIIVTVRILIVDDDAPPCNDLTLGLRQAGYLTMTAGCAEELVARVWVGELQTVYVHVRWLREKLEQDPAHPRLLVTVTGAGYKLDTAMLKLSALA